MLKCCFTSTETVGLLGTGARDVQLDFHTAPELCPSALLYVHRNRRFIRDGSPGRTARQFQSSHGQGGACAHEGGQQLPGPWSSSLRSGESREALSPFLTGRMFVRRIYFGQFNEL